MGRKKQMAMGCRDCRKCSASGMGKAGLNAGRVFAGLATAGLSEAGRFFTRNCGQCGHPLQLHTGNRITNIYDQQTNPTPQPQQQQPQPATNTADELLKLKQLLDVGVLTQQEFDQQKAKLLGG